MNEMRDRHKERMNPKGNKTPRNVFDSLMSVNRKEREAAGRAGLFESSSDESVEVGDMSIYLLVEESDSSSDGMHFAKWAGIFMQDFPPSPKVSKGKGEKSSCNDSGNASQSVTATT